MPIITLNLVPPTTDPAVLKKLVCDLFKVVASIPELELTEKDVTVLLPSDILDWGIGSELIVFVDGLFEKPKRTQRVIDNLVEKVGDRVKQFAQEHVPQCTKIEVLCRQQHPHNGFWSVTLDAAHPLDK